MKFELYSELLLCFRVTTVCLFIVAYNFLFILFSLIGLIIFKSVFLCFTRSPERRGSVKLSKTEKCVISSHHNENHQFAD